MARDLKSDFCLEIDFKKDSPNPSRVFRALSDLIEACHQLDQSLIATIDSQIKPVILLEDVESGSVKVWLKQQVEKVDDKVLESGDWKKAAGAFLVKSKYILISFLHEDIWTGDGKILNIEKAESAIKALAEDTQIWVKPHKRHKCPTEKPTTISKIES